MRATNDRAPAPGSNGDGSGRAGTSTIPRNSDVPRIPGLGCPCGCALDRHECGVGEPLPPLPTPGPRDRGGRDLTLQQLAAIAARWLERKLRP